MRRDTQAVAEGVREGMGHGKAININRASREDLLELPGLTEREARLHHCGSAIPGYA